MRTTSLALLAACAAGIGAPRAMAQPGNDTCASASPAAIGGTTPGTCAGALADGHCACDGEPAPDAFHVVRTAAAGVHTFGLCGGTWDSVLSLHRGCPASAANEIICNDDGCRAPGQAGYGFPSILSVYLDADTTYFLRIAAYDTTVDAGAYGLSILGPSPRTGACCTGGACSLLSQIACGAAGGAYAGDLSACALPAGNAQSYTDSFGAMLIPDGLPAGVSRTISVPEAFEIGDVRISMNIVHGFVGDLTVHLIHGGRVATLAQRVGVGPLGSDATLAGTYSFDDTAAATLWQYAPTPASGRPVPPGAYLCTDLLANVGSIRHVFGDLNAAGDWTLQVIDTTPGYTGALTAWTLTVDRAGERTCIAPQGACCGGGAACSFVSGPDCAGAGGSFQGAGVACQSGPGNPVPCCRANFNGAAGVEVQDLFDYLGAWFAGTVSADMDGNGVDTTDIFSFLGLWWVGC